MLKNCTLFFSPCVRNMFKRCWYICFYFLVGLSRTSSTTFCSWRRPKFILHVLWQHLSVFNIWHSARQMIRKRSRIISLSMLDTLNIWRLTISASVKMSMQNVLAKFSFQIWKYFLFEDPASRSCLVSYCALFWFYRKSTITHTISPYSITTEANFVPGMVGFVQLPWSAS